MTLEREFAQVREARRKGMEALAADVHPYSAQAVREWEEQHEIALSSIERHVQDMARREGELESLLRQVAWNDSTGLCWCPGNTERDVLGEPHTERCLAIRAALPAREKGTE